MTKKKLSKQDLPKFLFENFYDKDCNCIDLSELDFRSYNCNVDTSKMAVNLNLYQGNQRAQYLDQSRQEADILNQTGQKARTISQYNQQAEMIVVDKLDNFGVVSFGDPDTPLYLKILIGADKYSYLKPKEEK